MRIVGLTLVIACLLGVTSAVASFGDFDSDGDVDLDDYTMFAHSLTGPGGGMVPGGEPGDLDVDDDVDLFDFAEFSTIFTGSGGRVSFPQRASTFTINLVPTSSTTVGPGETVDYQITGQFTGGTTLGLGLWGVNLSADYDVLGGLPQASRGANMGSFVNDEGLTNPEGYGGTDDGEGGLWQIGGSQNTIGNTLLFGFPYPTGDVVLGIGLSKVVLATGTVTVPEVEGDYELSVDTPFGTTILADAGTFYEVGMTNAVFGSWNIDIAVVPEPATVSLLALGGLLTTRRRR